MTSFIVVFEHLEIISNKLLTHGGKIEDEGVVLPTGSGKTFVAELCIAKIARPTLIVLLLWIW